MRTLLCIGLLGASLALLPMTSEAGFCGSGKKSKSYYYPVYTPTYWLGYRRPVNYYYYAYPATGRYYH